MPHFTLEIKYVSLRLQYVCKAETHYKGEVGNSSRFVIVVCLKMSMFAAIVSYLNVFTDMPPKPRFHVPNFSLDWIFCMGEIPCKWSHWHHLVGNVTSGQLSDELQHELRSSDCSENTGTTLPTLDLGHSPKATSTTCLFGKLSWSCNTCGLYLRFLRSLGLGTLHGSLGVWWKFPDFEVRGGSHFWLGSCNFYFFFFWLTSWCQKNHAWFHIWRLAQASEPQDPP